MSSRTHPDSAPLFAGLDAGGSKTSLLARVDGAEDVRLNGPAANLQRAGLDGTARVLADLVREAAALRPDAPLGAVCAGVSGAGRPADGPRLAAAVRDLLGTDAPIRVVHDGEIALEGAFEGGSGVIVIAGTGSIALARTPDGALARSGGWGYVFGDEGSGHALGAGGLRAVANAFDGGPATALTGLVAAHLGLAEREDLIDRVYREALPVQQVAPLVLRAAADGDAPARRIVDAQTAALAEQVRWLAGRCPDAERRVALIGGLSNEATYREAFFGALRTALPEWTHQKPTHTPVEGALRMAQALVESAV